MAAAAPRCRRRSHPAELRERSLGLGTGSDRHLAHLVVGLRQRYLDAENSVGVGGIRLTCHHIGTQFDDPAERAVLYLDLLVEPALGLLGTPPPGYQELSAANLE